MADTRVLIVSSRYYSDVAAALEQGASAALDAASVQRDLIEAPGALEIPGLIAAAGATGDYQGFVALGCVIRGETSHYDIVSAESARGLMDLTLRGPDGADGEGLVIGNGILTVDTRNQAMERAQPEGRDKGGDAARACLAVMQARWQLEEGL